MDPIESEFAELVRIANSVIGIEDVVSKIYAILYLEPDAISMDELAKRTGYSLASICNKIKSLEASGMVRKEHKPKSKRVYVYMHKDVIKIMREILARKQQHCMEATSSALPSLIEKYSSKAKSDKEKKRVEILKNYLKQIIRGKQIIAEFTKKLEEIEQ